MTNIIQDFIPAGRKNRPGRVNPMLYITVHNTGNTSKGAGAKNHAIYVKGDAAANMPLSWHYTVDESVIYQHLPDNEDGYHAGDGSGNGNRKSIGIEICMNSDGNILKATDNAVELVASLCKKHSIAIGNVVQHNHWTGKNCPQRIREGNPYNWDTFIGKVKALLGETPQPVTPPTPTGSIKKGDLVKLAPDAVYYDGSAIPSWVKGQNWIVKSVSGDRAVLDKSETGTNSINSPVNVKYLSVVGKGAEPAPAVSGTTSLKKGSWNVRKGPSLSAAVVRVVTSPQTVTYVDVIDGFYKLRDGNYISVNACE